MASKARVWHGRLAAPRSWMYITLMGRQGLTRASQAALLNANYISKRLAAHYKTLYTDRNDLVAHECILDLRPLKDTSGIEAEDSESKFELDRFCDAMIQIREEIQAIADGKLDRDDNPLKNAPHTATQIGASEWTHAYPRELAAFPLASLKQQKYWPPVARVDNVYGDKNVFCSCVPTSDFKDEPEAFSEPNVA